MDGKFLSEETKDLIVTIADDITKAGIFEPIDGAMYRFAVNQIDKYADKVVPDEYDEMINQVASLALNGHYEEAAQAAGVIIDGLVDLEKVNDEIEKLIFVDGLRFIVRQIQYYIEKKKG